MRGRRIDCARRKTAHAERKRGDDRDALRRKHIAIYGKERTMCLVRARSGCLLH